MNLFRDRESTIQIFEIGTGPVEYSYISPNFQNKKKVLFVCLFQATPVSQAHLPLADRFQDPVLSPSRYSVSPLLSASTSPIRFQMQGQRLDLSLR